MLHQLHLILHAVLFVSMCKGEKLIVREREWRMHAAREREREKESEREKQKGRIGGRVSWRMHA